MAQAESDDGPSHALERLAFFSDAVFAIAITLLIIEIHVPEVHPPYQDIDFAAALAPLAPSFLSFFISFFVIGAFWAGHHRAFDCARHYDPKLLFPNLQLLCAIAAMPFVTAFASDYWGHRVPMALYCGWMLITSLLNLRLQRIVLAPPVAAEDIGDRAATIRTRGLSVALGSATALVASLIVPALGQPAMATIFFWRLVLQRVGRRPVPPSGT